jgi:hypothetical protein
LICENARLDLVDLFCATSLMADRASVSSMPRQPACSMSDVATIVIVGPAAMLWSVVLALDTAG